MIRIAIVLVSLPGVSCATVDLPKVKGGERIESETFSVVAPPGQWHLEVDRDADSVTLIRTLRGAGGRRGDRRRVPAVRGEERGVRRGVERRRLFEGTERGVRELGGMRLHSLTYAKMLGLMNFVRRGPERERGVLYVYVPEDVLAGGVERPLADRSGDREFPSQARGVSERSARGTVDCPS